jgi:hypothetical protein
MILEWERARQTTVLAMLCPLAAGTTTTALVSPLCAGIQVAGAEVASESYRLVYVTGDKLGAGTDATVRTEFTDVRGTRWQPAFAQVSEGARCRMKPSVTGYSAAL